MLVDVVSSFVIRFERPKCSISSSLRIRCLYYIGRRVAILILLVLVVLGFKIRRTKYFQVPVDGLGYNSMQLLSIRLQNLQQNIILEYRISPLGRTYSSLRLIRNILFASTRIPPVIDCSIAPPVTSLLTLTTIDLASRLQRRLISDRLSIPIPTTRPICVFLASSLQYTYVGLLYQNLTISVGRIGPLTELTKLDQSAELRSDAYIGGALVLALVDCYLEEGLALLPEYMLFSLALASKENKALPVGRFVSRAYRTNSLDIVRHDAVYTFDSYTSTSTSTKWPILIYILFLILDIRIR